MQTYVDNLNGYFQVLRRLSKNRCDFWSELIEIDGTLENTIEEYLESKESVEFLNKKDISYSEVQELYESYIFSNITVSTVAHKLLTYDIVEYYGLASTSTDSNNDFNPLISNGAVLLNVRSEFHSEYIYYVVEYGNKAIVTGLATRA